MPFTNEVVAGETLVRNAIKSALYQAGVSGWRIARDGSAEFNNLTIRGVFNGTDFIINNAGAFFYDGIPATNNLVTSVTSADGVDGFGNTYLNGVTVYDTAGNTQPVGYIQMIGQSLIYGSVVSGVWQDLSTGAGALQSFGSTMVLFSLMTPGDPTSVDQAGFSVTSGEGGQTTGSALAPFAQFLDNLGTSAVDFMLPGNMRRTDLAGIPLTKQVPGALAPVVLNANWTVGAAAIRNSNPLRIWIDTNDTLHVSGSVATLNATPGNVVATLSAPYLPVNNATFGVPQGAILQQTSAGAFKAMAHCFLQASNSLLQINLATYAIGDIFTFDHHWPLGNLP